MLRLLKADRRLGHEEMFLAHYEQLLGWSLKLTGQDRQQAEDLVHDLFVRFVLMQPALDEIENVEGYLFAMLRNLLRSRVARESRLAGQSLSLLDYDSAEIGLRSTDPRELMRVQDELRLICQYAIARREHSRAGSAMLLRYFLGYYPSEISRLLRSSPAAVDRLLSNARSEARLYLDQPDRLRFLKETNQPDKPARQPLPEPADDFLAGLTREIFRSCQRECLPVRKIGALYQEPAGQAIETRTLAHLVSCPHCLDHVNRILGLPLLSERYPTDTLGPDPDGRGGSGSGGEGGSGSSVAKNAVRKFRRRLREVIEHQPKELRVAVNGELIGTLAVNSEVNKLGLRLEDPARISFIEVLSEQNLGLFLLNVTPPPEGEFEQAASAAFNNQRQLAVSLSFSGPKASLEVVYTIPQSVTAHLPVALEVIESDPSPEALSPPEAEPGASLLSRWRGSFERWGSLLRPGPLAVAISLVLAFVALVFFRMSDRPVSAAELIRRSVMAERQLTSQPGQALHRTYRLEETDPATNRVLRRQRIEVWQRTAEASAGAIKVRRLYDEQNQLIAGEWRQADGSRTIYRKHKAGEEPQLEFRNLALWQVEPAADDFSSLIEQADAATVEENPAVWIVSYSAGSTEGRNELLRATLVIDRASLRAVEQTLMLRLNGQVRAFKVAETNIERHPLDKVAPNVFTPEPELLPERTKDEGGKVKAAPSPATLPSLTPRPSPTATTELEVEVLHLLNKIGATLGEEVSVRRTVDGALQVEGLVENAERKTAILSALDSVAGHPAIRLRIETPEEAQQRTPRQPPAAPGVVSIREAVPSGSSIPVEAEVRRYLLAKGTPEASINEQINQFANRTLNRSRQSMLHVWELRKLARRFTPEELRRMEPKAREKWLELIREHAGGCQREVALLGQELTPVFNGGTPADEAVSEINDDAMLARAILRLVELHTANDDAIRSAFTLSAGGGSLAVKTPAFWRSLASAESLATKLRAAAQQLKRAASNDSR